MLPLLLTTRQLALFSVLVATCLGIQLSPRLPNVEFTSLITFTTGAVFGSFMGGTFGVLIMFANGFLSPWGVAGVIMPFQVAGMSVIGVAGGFFRRYESNGNSARLCVEAAVLGAFLTLFYDIVTNTGVAVFSEQGFVLVLVAGMWFSLVHICSNTVLFGFTFAPLLKILQNLSER